jgi:hypothetical protein
LQAPRDGHGSSEEDTRATREAADKTALAPQERAQRERQMVR